jgi:cyclopropane fatty-acyl-phospholipid synthase-like methyltransferase
MNDNTKNSNYRDELVARFGPDMKYMDLGCAGGGFVSQFLEKGVFAVGLEGSDYCLKAKKDEWANYPDYLFTCDITKPFSLLNADTDEPLLFDAVSAFDVFEHIPKEGLKVLLPTIAKHMKSGGILITGIATFPDGDYHVTLEDEEWWDKTIFEYGFKKAEKKLNHFGRETSLNLIYEKI